METEQGKSGFGSFVNPVAILALLTFAASTFLVSRKLSSNRPPASEIVSSRPIGAQKVESRLWEDPLVGWERRGDSSRILSVSNLSLLRDQIAARNQDSPIILLPVMISGGAYSEDRESRIRSRFAIVSALSERGLAPEDAEHLGALELAWPSSAQWHSRTNPAHSSPAPLDAGEAALRLSYEWYRPKTFYPRPANQGEPRLVLVLWLEEDQFEDSPLERLDHLLTPLLDTGERARRSQPLEVALIGPRKSATLRAMLPAYEAGSAKPPTARHLPPTNALRHTRLFITTASAMDEVLVTNSAPDAPRSAVLTALTNGLFLSAASFCSTDSRLATEVLDELRLRELDFSRPENHLALISEWDTFYGRMLSLTYAANMAARQNPKTDERTFVARYRAGHTNWPVNLESFVYLRGLDGQTTTQNADSASGSDRNGARPQGPASLDELRGWTSVANKPEGRGQLDYLSRLGDLLLERDRDLRRRGEGSIRAVGIVGSDVYDTLLILQELRPLFPGTVFFTTELDARLWQQSEWEWSRNLVVVSSYGLQLARKLQHQVPPFRDSAQTALFTATLAALGESELGQLDPIWPRRFEIGRFGPVDLSVTNPGPLHPNPPGTRGQLPFQRRVGLAGLLAAGFVIMLASLIFRPWIQLTRERRHYEAKVLWLREEDIGGIQGFRHIQQQMDGQLNPLTTWLHQQLNDWPVQQGHTEFFKAQAAAHGEPGSRNLAAQLLRDQDQMQHFLDFLNARLQHHHWIPLQVIEQSGILSRNSLERYRAWAETGDEDGPFLTGNALATVKQNREVLDEILEWLLHNDAGIEGEKNARRIHSRASAAHSARAAGWRNYRLRHGRWLGFWAWVALGVTLVLLLGRSAWLDTWASTIGEPFSLSSGISAWPTECLRLGTLLLALAFLGESYFRLRTSVLELTRLYRLTLVPPPGELRLCLPTSPVPEAVVQADRVWERYQQMGAWPSRCRRILLPLAAYFGFAACLWQLGTSPHNPFRGERIQVWDVGLLLSAVVAYLFLTFWTLDAARLCRWFIEHLSQAPCRFPKAAREHFSSLRGGLPGYLLEEWLTLRLIAQLTDRIGRLIYLPFILFFLLLLARNPWWDLWSWSPILMLIFAFNLLLAAGGVFILQRSALRARARALDSLRAKLDRLREAASTREPEKSLNAISQGEQLLQEIQRLDTGAFSGFWQNPIVGALLVPSGGSALIELLQYCFGR
jgi:hypothetical protein